MSPRPGGTQFRVLGQLDVHVEGRQVVLGGPKQRAVLAMLLLAAGRPVSLAQLSRGLWFEPPPRARNVIQVFASRLRADLPIIWTPAGYQLCVPPEAVDLSRVLAVCGSSTLAACDLRRALGEWRSEPLAEFTAEPFAEVERLRLAEVRLQLLRRLLDQELLEGRHHEIVGELQGLVAEFPFHEWLWERLVLALYRSGRQADALATIDRVTTLLRSELGVDPTPALRAMREQILVQHDFLTADLSTLSGGGVSAHRRGTSRAGDRQLMSAVLEKSAMTRRSALLTILGPPGMGKTHLLTEVHASHAGEGALLIRCDSDRSGGGLEDLVARLSEEADPGGWTVSLGAQRLELHRRLDAKGRRSPFVLLVDDAHEAGDALLDAVERLPAHVHAPVVVIAAGRPELLERRPAWASATPNARTIRLAPLSEDEALAVCREHAGPAVPDRVLRRVVARSGGRPLALISSLRCEPDSREVLAASKTAVRLRHLDPRATLLAGCAAALGSEVDLAELDRARQGVVDGDSGHLVQVLAAAGVLAVPEGGPCRFSHESMRDQALAALSPAQRARVHANAVGLLVDGAVEGPVDAPVNGPMDGHPATPRRGLDVSSLVHHLRHAELSPTADLLRLATDRLAGHGRRLLALGDAREARRPFEAVVASLPRGDPQRLSALSDLGAALADAGELSEAAAVLTQATAEADLVNDRVASTRAVVERDWLRIDAAPTAETFERVARRTRRSVVLLAEARELTGLVRARLLLSAVANLQGRRREQVRQAELVLDVPQHRVGRRDWSAAVSLVAGGMAEGPYAASALLVRAGHFTDLSPGDPTVQLAVAGPRAVAEAMLGDFATARRTVVDGRAVAEELGLVWVTAMLAWRGSLVEDLAGRLDAAERDMRFVVEVYRRMGERSHLSTAMASLADIVARQGRLPEARDLIAGSRAFASEDDVASQVVLRLALARTALQADDPTSATEIAQASAHLARAADLTMVKGELLLLRAEAASASGSPHDVRRLLEGARRLLRTKGSPVLDARVRSVRVACRG